MIETIQQSQAREHAEAEKQDEALLYAKMIVCPGMFGMTF